MKMAWIILLVLLAIAATAVPQASDMSQPKDLFDRRCGGCHSVDRPMEGPKLRGVYGRRAGSTENFQYSEALKNAKFTWNEDLLDKWLTDTESLVPDNDMSFRVVNPDERRAIIAYLKSLSP
jgi:cytochrome c